VPVAQAPALEQQAKASEPVPTAQPATTEAKLEPAATTQPSATAEKAELAAATRPSQRAASNSCNVQACSAAYQSFRGSDCTYQPYGGERRLCSMSGGAVTARAVKPDRPERSEKSERASRRSGAPDDLREVERVVKRQPSDVHSGSSRAATPSRGEMTEVERIVRHMTRDEADDISVEDGDGRVFIVRKGYR